MHVTADMLLVNARVLTMDPGNPFAEAVAVAGEKILAVGPSAYISRYRAHHTEVIDCQGLPLIPGINDAHCHLLATAASLSGLDCGDEQVRSVAGLLPAIRQRALEIPEGSWIRGYGLDPGSLKEARYPSRWELDSAAPRHPVRLDHASGHASVLNSLALEAAGIGPDTADPMDGVIERDPATGQPTGLLLEMAGFLRKRLGNTRSPSELERSVSRLSDRLLGYGITSVQDAGPNNGTGQWDTLGALVSSKAFRPRITMMAGAGKLDEFAQAGLGWASGDEWLRLGHAKMMLTLTTGDLYPAPEDLERIASAALGRGFPFAVHAVEREALATVLELPQLNQQPQNGLRPGNTVSQLRRAPLNRIEHCAECPPDLMEKLSRSRATVVTQPGFIYWRGDRYMKHVSPDLLPHLYDVEQFARRGVRLAFGSDTPLIDPNPWPGIYAAVTGRTSDGATFPRLGQNSSQPANYTPTMDFGRALAAYTLGGAAAEGASNFKGRIKEGMLADLALLDVPVDDREMERVRDTRARLTILGGRVVWDSDSGRNVKGATG